MNDGFRIAVIQITNKIVSDRPIADLRADQTIVLLREANSVLTVRLDLLDK